MSDSVANKTRVAVVGAGYVSTYHIRALQTLDHVAVVAIADADQARAQETAARFQIPAVYGSLAEMAAARPNVVHILTPPASHCPLALEALAMGCHVFVEKPMAETAEDCQRMLAASQEAGRYLSVNHSARFDPVVLEGLERVRKGEVGDVLGVDFLRSSDYPPYAGGPFPPPYRKGSYPFQDLGVHGLYLLEAFLGELTTVEARYYASGRDPNLLFDEWQAIVRSHRGGTGHMYLSWNVRPMQNEIIVHGSNGALYIDCLLQTCTLRRVLPGPKAIGRVLMGMANAASMLWNVPLNMARFATGRLRPSPGIHEAVRQFHLALRDGVPPPVLPEEGWRAVSWMEEVSRRADADKQRHQEDLAFPAAAARVLVTGGTGFLGKAVVRRLLERGDRVRVLARKPSRALQSLGNVSVVYGDLGDPQAVDRAVEGVEVVYHVGAAMGGGKEEFERGTIWGTRNVTSSCLRHGIRRLVYVSSLSVLDHAGHPAGVPVTEQSPYEPQPDSRGHYTRTKLEAERMVLEAVQQGLPAVILRPGQIFGPGVERTPPSGTISLAGRWLVVGDGSRHVPLVYVDDVADSLLLAEAAPRADGSVYHIVDPTPVTQRQYVQQCQHSKLVTCPPALYVPERLMMGLAWGVEQLGKLLKRGVPLTRYRVRSIRPLAPCDVSTAREGLRWVPQVGVREGLLRTYQAVPQEAVERVPVSR